VAAILFAYSANVSSKRLMSHSAVTFEVILAMLDSQLVTFSLPTEHIHRYHSFLIVKSKWLT